MSRSLVTNAVEFVDLEPNIVIARIIIIIPYPYQTIYPNNAK